MPCLEITTTAGGGYITRTANLPSFAAVSVAGWVKLSASTPGSHRSIATLVDQGAWVSGFHRWTDGTSVAMDGAVTGSTSASLSPSPDESGVWVYCAFSRDNTAGVKVYWWNAAGVLQATETVMEGSTALTADALAVGARAAYNDRACLGRYAYWKVWDAVLTQAELAAEQFVPFFVRQTDKNTGFASSATDISGNGRNWTLGGSVSVVTDDGPPVQVRPAAGWTVIANSGDNYTIPAAGGGDRLVCAIICGESSAAAADTTVTASTLSGVLGVDVSGPFGFSTASNYVCARLWTWNEAALAGLSGAVPLTWAFEAAGGDNSYALVRCVGGVNQTTPILSNTGTLYKRNTSNATTELTVALAESVAGGYGIYGGICRSTSPTFSLPTPNGWSKDTEAADKSLSKRFAGSKLLTAGGPESFGFVASTSTTYAIGAWIINPASTGGGAAPPAGGQPFMARHSGIPGMSPNRPRFGRGW
jgi:hypothetical protein